MSKAARGMSLLCGLASEPRDFVVVVIIWSGQVYAKLKDNQPSGERLADFTTVVCFALLYSAVRVLLLYQTRRADDGEHSANLYSPPSFHPQAQRTRNTPDRGM